MSEPRDLTLTAEQRDLCRFLKRSYGSRWPFAAHIAKDVLAFLAEPKGEAQGRTDRSPSPGMNKDPIE